MYAPKAITGIYTKVHAKMPGIQNGGVVGDADHGYGYHLSPKRLKQLGKANDYSLIEPLDKGSKVNADAASALDLTPKAAADQQLICRRLMAASKAKDPRLKALREWFGSVDGGHTVTGYSLYRGRTATADSSHKWHTHLSIWRSYQDDVDALQGIVDVILGVEPQPKYLPPMQVGGQRLLACNPDKGTVTWREVGYPVTTIVRVAGAYSVTDSGNYYPTAMLTPKEN